MPDVEIQPQRYRDDRPPEHFELFHTRVRAGEPEAHVYEIVRIVKSQLFSSPVPTYIFSHGGVFPVRRGAHDDEARPGIGRLALESADRILDRIRTLHAELVGLGHQGSRRAARSHAVA